MGIKPVFLLGVLLLLISAGCEDPLSAVPIGVAAPAFTLNHLNGKAVNFPENYRGKVVAIRFWADWCPYCKNEMKTLEPVYRKYHDHGLLIVAINVMQPPMVVQNFIAEIGISYDVLLDTQGEIMRRYGVMGLPMTFIVDRQGVVRARIVGEATAKAFEKIVIGLL